MTHSRMETAVWEILNEHWDPLGVSHMVRNEYDGYVSGVTELIVAGGTSAELAQFLLDVEVNRMGLRRASIDRREQTAALLTSLI